MDALNPFPIDFTPDTISSEVLKKACPVKTASKLKKIPVWVWAMVFCLVALCLAGGFWFWWKKRRQAQPQPQTPPPSTAPHPKGRFLTTSKGGYVNVEALLFPDSDNPALGLVVESNPETRWWITEQGALTTNVDGMDVTWQQGPPGLGTEWGIGYVAPVGTAPNVLFHPVDLTVQNGPVWPKDPKTLQLGLRGNQIIWGAAPIDLMWVAEEEN